MPIGTIFRNIVLAFAVFSFFASSYNFYMLFTTGVKDFIRGSFIWGIIFTFSTLIYISIKKIFGKPQIIIDFDKEIKNDDFKELEAIVKNLSDEDKGNKKVLEVNPVRKSKRYKLGKTTEKVKLVVRRNHQEQTYDIVIKDISKGGMFFVSNGYLEGNEKNLKFDISEKFEEIEILFVRKASSTEEQYLYGYGIKFSDNIDNGKRMDIINYFKEKYIIDKDESKN